MRNLGTTQQWTSFHDVTIHATAAQLREALGQPTLEPGSYPPGDKSRYKWVMETKRQQVFTVYDWKEFRDFPEDEIIKWHIGARMKLTAIDAAQEIQKIL